MAAEWKTQTVKGRLESLVQLFDFHDTLFSSLRENIFRLAYYSSYSSLFIIENSGQLVRKYFRDDFTKKLSFPQRPAYAIFGSTHLDIRFYLNLCIMFCCLEIVNIYIN